MKTLFLQGFGISIKVVDGKVRITNGKSLFNNHKNEREIIEVSGTPNFDKIVIEGTSGPSQRHLSGKLGHEQNA